MFGATTFCDAKGVPSKLEAEKVVMPPTGSHVRSSLPCDPLFEKTLQSPFFRFPGNGTRPILFPFRPCPGWCKIVTARIPWVHFAGFTGLLSLQRHVKREGFNDYRETQPHEDSPLARPELRLDYGHWIRTGRQVFRANQGECGCLKK